MSADTFKKIALFVFANILGFSVPTLLFLGGVTLNLFPADDPQAAAVVQNELFHGSIITWMVCAVFSVSYFFLKGRAGLMFLWAPVVLPLLYGLKVLVS